MSAAIRIRQDFGAATLRHLANAARMLENNPALVTLKTLQTVSEGKHTLVLGLSNPVIPLSTPSGASNVQEQKPQPPETTEGNI